MMSVKEEKSSEPTSTTVILREAERIITEEATDALTVDRQRLQTVWETCHSVVLRSSPVQQFGIGFGVGWLSGYLFKRVSRTAAFMVGCAFIVVQGASSLGVISVNWQRLRILARRNLQRMEGHVSAVRHATGVEDASGSITDQMMALASQHMFLSSGFASGAVAAITF